MSANIQLKEKYQVLPSMPPEQFEALKADIDERGVLTPIDVDENGHILDGHHRYRACLELGLTDFPTIVRPGMSEEERRMFARKSNMLRRHLNRAQVRLLIADQLKDTPKWANNRIASQLGVDGKTVASVRVGLEATSEIPKFNKLISADGKERPVKQKRPPAIMAPDASELQRILSQLDQGVDIEKLEGFLSEHGFSSIATIVTPNYNPFAHCSNAEEKEWHIFVLFMIKHGRYELEGASAHAEYLLQKQFKTPSEWLGDEGTKWRRGWGGKDPTKKYLKAWADFLSEQYDRPASEIVAEIKKISKPGVWA